MSGQRPAGQDHRLACLRHQRDREREGTAGFPYILDAKRAKRACEFFQQLKHYKGEWAGQPIVLEPWQVFLVGSTFGWVHQDSQLRRFRKVYVEIPRKSGKSLLAAGVALYTAFFDGEPGAEGYCAATKRDQAMIVFGDARRLVMQSGLKKWIAVNVRNLNRVQTASKLEPLSADYDSMDGLNPHVAIIDELHAHKDRGILDVLETAMGARRQPLIFEITTAGSDPLSPCGDEHAYAAAILKADVTDESVLAFRTHADPSDDPFAEATWQKANPNLGVSVKPDDLRALATQAQHVPSALAVFKQKRLNIWVQSATPWLHLEGWTRGQTVWTDDFRAALDERPCWAGVDLSSKTDLTAFVRVVPPTEDDPKWYLVPYFLTPEDGVEDRARQARAPYQEWIDQGWLHTCPGPRIDQEVLVEAILRVTSLEQVGVDPWNAGNLPAALSAAWGDDEGLKAVEIPQNITQLSEPSKEFEALVSAGLLDAGGHPILTWMIGNAVVIRDGNDNIKPTKDPKKSRGRIDGVMAAIMGLKLARRAEPEDEPYTAERGIQTLSWGG